MLEQGQWNLRVHIWLIGKRQKKGESQRKGKDTGGMLGRSIETYRSLGRSRFTSLLSWIPIEPGAA